jgi:hypothetical protein
MSDLETLLAQLSDKDRAAARFDLDMFGFLAVDTVTEADGSKSCVRVPPERVKFIDGRYEVDGRALKGVVTR